MFSRNCDNERFEIAYEVDRIRQLDPTVISVRNKYAQELTMADLLDVLVQGGKLHLSCHQGRLLRLVEQLDRSERMLQVDLVKGLSDSRFIQLLQEIHGVLKNCELSVVGIKNDVAIMRLMVDRILSMAARGFRPSYVVGEQLLKISRFLLKRPFERRFQMTWRFETDLLERMSRLSAAGRLRAVRQEDESADLRFNIYAIPDDDASRLEKLRAILQEWFADKLNCRELVDDLHSQARQVRSADTEWWSRFHGDLAQVCMISHMAECDSYRRHDLVNTFPDEAHRIGSAVRDLIETCNQITTDLWAT